MSKNAMTHDSRLTPDEAAILAAGGTIFLKRDPAGVVVNMSAKSLANLACLGDGPPICYVGPRSPRYRLSELLAWATTRTVPHTSAAQARNNAE